MKVDRAGLPLPVEVGDAVDRADLDRIHHDGDARGVAGQDFSSSEKVADKTYTLRSSKSTVSFGIILDSGSELGYGFSLGAHYLPFGKFKIKIGEANEVLPKKVDFSMIMVALGLRFNFN